MNAYVRVCMRVGAYTKSNEIGVRCVSYLREWHRYLLAKTALMSRHVI